MQSISFDMDGLLYGVIPSKVKRNRGI
jgi:hypothetical protein